MTIIRFWPKPAESPGDGLVDLLGELFQCHYSKMHLELASSPRYRLTLSQLSPLLPEDREIFILLSQHLTSKDRPINDISIYVFEEYTPDQSDRKSHASVRPSTVRNPVSDLHEMKKNYSTLQNPFNNSVHVMVSSQT